MPHPQADVIDAYWARRFGCLLSDIQTPGVHLVCREDVDPNRMAVLELKHSTLVRAALEHEEMLVAWAKSLAENTPRSADDVTKAFPDQKWKVSASEKVLYLNPAEFRPFPRPEVRQLTLADSDDLTAMHWGCTLAEQQAGEVNIEHPAIFGAYAQDQLVAAASFIDQGQTIADVGVLVHRDFRKQGYGRAVVSALCQWGLANGRIVQYWRLDSNLGSVHIADALGFEAYGIYQTLHLSISPFF
jgi:RimJ/RimL family protein N-acetyltransferase